MELFTIDNKMIKAYHGQESELIIPETVQGIGKEAFKGHHELKSVTLPEGLVLIEESAFEGCGLTSLTIPGEVFSIAKYAFKDCIDLKSLSFKGEKAPVRNSYPSERPFAGCINLEELSCTFPEEQIIYGSWLENRSIFIKNRYEDDVRNKRCIYCGSTETSWFGQQCRKCGKWRDL